MQSTPNLRDTDPHDVFVIEPDVSLADRPDKAPLDLLYDVLSRPSDPTPSQVRPDPELRIAPDFSASAAVPSVDAAADIPVTDIKLGDTEISAHQPAASKLARGAVMGLFALVSATGAAAWQHYGDDAKAMLARYAPPFALAALASPEKPAAAEQPAAVVTQASAAQAAAPAAAAAATALGSPDQTQVIQSMARDLAVMGQQITELKATVEQLRASQQQAAATPARTETRLVEPKPAEPRAVEPVLTRPRIVPPPAHSTVTTLARRPKQTFPYAPIAPASPPPQAAGAAPAQIAPQVQAAEDGGPVVRPPMPLH
jgi:hypothetical protein